MAINYHAQSKKTLEAGERRFIILAAIASLPGYLATLIVVLGIPLDSVFGHQYGSSHEYLDALSTMSAALPLVGILTHPVALLIVLVGSGSSVGPKGKTRAWQVVAGGIAAWIFSLWFVWLRPSW